MRRLQITRVNYLGPTVNSGGRSPAGFYCRPRGTYGESTASVFGQCFLGRPPLPPAVFPASREKSRRATEGKQKLKESPLGLAIFVVFVSHPRFPLSRACGRFVCSSLQVPLWHASGVTSNIRGAVAVSRSEHAALARYVGVVSLSFKPLSCLRAYSFSDHTPHSRIARHANPGSAASPA